MEKECSKCGYSSDLNLQKLNKYLCPICSIFSPANPSDFEKYISEKIPSEILSSFRKYHNPRGNLQKKGMIEKASDGNVMSRAPFGYNIIEKKLVPAQNADEVREIFEEFLAEKISLRQIALKHKLSINGLKKILRNFAYIGKIKFNNQIHDSSHTPIISTTLFNHVQNKLERLGIRR